MANSAQVGLLRVLLTADTAEYQAAMKGAAGSAQAWTNDLSKLNKMVDAFSGRRIIQDATLMAKVFEDAGGSAKFTEAELQRMGATGAEAATKLRALGMEVPPGIQKIADEMNRGGQATTGWLSILHTLGGSFVARVAEGVLLRDAIHGVVDVVKDGIEAFPRLIEHTVTIGNSLYEMSLKTGASVETLSKLRYVASQTGIDFESFSTTLFKMEKFLGANGAAAREAQKHLDVLGLSLQTLKNEKPAEAFIDIIAALEQIPNRADQAAAGAAIFGRGFKEMAGLAQENIRALMEDAEKLGLVMTTETAAAAHAAEVGFKALGMQLEAVGMRIGAAFLPAIIGLEQNISTVFTSVIAEANTGLDKMGKPGSGFLATVATAMGTGNTAIAAQVTLYEDLRDAMISMVRHGIEPIVTAFGFVMVEVNAAKVVFGDIAQVIDGVRLAFLLTKQAMALGLLPGTADLQKWKALDEQIQNLEITMEQRGKSLQADKKKEEEWSNSAVAANKKIEEALNRLGATHTDVAGVIADFSAKSRKAYGGLGEEVDTIDKKSHSALTAFQDSLKKLTDTIDSAVAHHVPLVEIMKLYGQQASKAAEEAVGWGVKVSDNVARVAAAFQAADLAKVLKKANKELDTDARQLLDSWKKLGAGAGAKLFAEQKASNKSFLANGLELQKGLLALEDDSLQKRLDLVRLEYQQKRDAVERGTTFTVDQLRLIDMQEAKAAEDATASWRKHVADVKAAASTYTNIFQHALAGIPGLIQAALTGGGGFAGAGKSILSGLSSDIGGHLFTDLTRHLSNAFSKIGTGFTSMMGTILPGIGAALGSLVGPLIDKIIGAFGTAGRDAIKQFSKTLTGSTDLNALHDKLLTIFDPAQAEKYWVLLSQGTGRNNAAQAAANIKIVEDAIAAAEAKATRFNTNLQGFLGKLKELGGGLPASLRDYLSGLEHAKGLTQENIDLLHALAGNGDVDWKKIEAAVGRYGGKIETLQGSFQAARLHDSWQQVIDDMDLFERGGISAGDALALTKGKITELVNESIKFGTEIPENMRPWIQHLINAGDLVDADGKKITDIGKLTFGETLQTSLQNLTDQIKLLIDEFKKLPSAVSQIPSHVDFEFRGRKTGDWPDSGDMQMPDALPIAGMATGGVVRYLASGGPSWRPRGTDTVPAMLTPGEGVVTRAGMSSLGVAGLTDINSGRWLDGLKSDLYSRVPAFEPTGGSGAQTINNIHVDASGAYFGDSAHVDDLAKKIGKSINRGGEVRTTWSREVNNMVQGR